MSPALAPLRGAIPTASATGGLRCALTPGYFLATLRVALRSSLARSRLRTRGGLRRMEFSPSNNVIKLCIQG